MLNQILPALYVRLRRHSKLTRKQFAVQLGIGRDTLRNYEAGKTRPDLETEDKLVAASRCTDVELVENLCEIMSKKLGLRVGIIDEEKTYRPATTLARAQEVERRYSTDIAEPMRRALANKLHTAQLMRLAAERHDADLEELAADCRVDAERRLQCTADPSAMDPSTQGATGTAGVAEPVFHNTATGRRFPQGEPADHRGDHPSVPSGADFK